MKELPKVLLCCFEVLPAPSAVSRRLTEYLKALGGHCSAVVLTLKIGEGPHIERYFGARLLRVPCSSPELSVRLQVFERAIRRQLESEEYAVVHFTDPIGGYPLCELKGQYGHRVIYDATRLPSHEWVEHHPELAGDRRLLSKLRRQELFCLMNADRVITASLVGKELMQSMGVPEVLTEVLPAPVDTDAYAKRLSPPSRTPMRLLYLGSQASWQGLPLLLRAFRRALDKQRGLRLSLVGPSHPSWHLRLRALSEELGLSNSIEFLDAVPHDDLPALLEPYDVGLVPLEDVERNRMGGSLAKASEYLAAGRPVIASNLPLCRSILPEGATAFFRPGDSQDLALKILELADDPGRRQAMALVARAHAIQKLRSQRVGARLLQLYQTLIGRAAPQKRTEAPIEEPSVQTEPEPRPLPPPRLNPWVAQLVHGYCPPEDAPPAPPAPTEPGKGPR